MEEKKIKSRGFLDFVKSRGRLWLLVGGAVLGLLLLLIGSGIGRSESGQSATAEQASDAEQIAAYQGALEAELTALCDAVAGVDRVEVMVTLAEGYRTVYATDENGKPVTVGGSTAGRALIARVEPPAIAGVGVVCRGGNDPHIQRTLVELISTTLGIPTNRVSVTGK